MEKVIYIGFQPITSNFYSNFYVDKCIDKGLEVEYWDITQLYFPNINFGEPFDFEGVKHIKSFNQLKSFLSLVEMKSSIFIIHITYCFMALRLFLILSAYNCPLAFFGRGMHPAPERTMTLKFREVILSLDYKRFIRGIGSWIAATLKQNKIVKNYDFIFSAGSEGYKTTGVGYQLDVTKGRVINVNYFDYDKYLDSLHGNPIIERAYCVFLDEYLPYHPDVAITGIKTVVADNYYMQLNKFFDFIENKYDLKVIIAAHPKAFKYKSDNPFDGRTIIFNRTCELVRDSEFVMTHHSTSMSFPILFKKPILFITSQAQKILMSIYYELTFFFGEYLNCQVIHFDNFESKEDFKFFVDVEKYDSYKYKYLTSKESENRISSEIFIETISKL